MVSDKSNKKDWSNNYWKPGFSENKTKSELITYLNRRGYTCSSTADRQAIIHAKKRYLRGLMSYRSLSVRELRGLCKARGLSTSIGTFGDFARATLEEADENAKFTKLFDLPPELRNMVYEWHFRGFDKINGKHYQPPLILASKQLRIEALPLFYEVAHFEVRMYTDYSLRPFYCGMMMYTPISIFANIKHLDLVWEGSIRHPFNIKFEVSTQFAICQDTHLTGQSAGKYLADVLCDAVAQKLDLENVRNSEELRAQAGKVLKFNVAGTLYKDKGEHKRKSLKVMAE